MKNKHNWKGFLIKVLPVYLIIATCFSIALVYVLNLRTSLNREEIFNVFVGVDNVNVNKLRTEIKNSIPNIKEINVYTTNTTSTTVFINDLSTKGLVSSDILILPSQILTLSTLPKNYFSFNELFEDEDFLEVEGKKYGLNMKDEDHVYLENCIEYKQDTYYLFINKKSKHCLNFSVNGLTDYAYKVVEGFVNV